MDDWALLSRYVQTGCQASFGRIVERHSPWLFSLALRAVRDRHLAEDVTQAVFIILARKAATIRQGTPLSGWLFKASRFAVNDALKRRTRIKNRENRFAEFFKAAGGVNGGSSRANLDAQGANAAATDELSQTLDEAVACLSETDRQAVLLRFYEGKSLAEVGVILGVSEEAAKKRVARAVEKLRKYFSTRGVVASLALLLLMLSRRSAEAAGFTPASITTPAAASLAQTIAQGALKLMAHAQARLLGAIFAAAVAILITLPTLGGAIVRLATASTKPQPAAPDQHIVTSGSFELSPANHLSLPKESRFADLWIGYKGELVWRSDAFTARTPQPILLKDAQKHERPYAVAVDPRGNVFIRPLDKAILESPVIRQSRFDYDTGPIDTPTRVHNMLSLIDSKPESFEESGGSGGGDGSSAAAAPLGRTKEQLHEDWQQLHPKIEKDGTIVIDEAPSRFNSINSGLFLQSSQDGYTVVVPEPATTALLLGATAFLLRRRHR